MPATACDLRRGVGQVLAIEHNLAGGDRHVARNTIEEGRLACPVRTDQANDIAGIDGEIGARDGAETAESF